MLTTRQIDLIETIWDVTRTCLGIVILVFMFRGHADVLIDDGTSDMYFKVDGTKVSASVAQDSAKRGAIVTQCKAVKNKQYETKDGSKLQAAYQCQAVDWVVTLKSGGGRWKKH